VKLKDLKKFGIIVKKKPRKKAIQYEDILHEQYFQEMVTRYPEIAKFIYKIEHRGKRSKQEGALRKRQGVKKGICDFQILSGKKGYHGLYIEFKVIYPDGKRSYLTPEQKQFIKNARSQGYKCLEHTDVESAIKDTLEYMGIKK
jgi:hypothetical protein